VEKPETPFAAGKTDSVTASTFDVPGGWKKIEARGYE
jgi:hypothetical protein